MPGFILLTVFYFAGMALQTGLHLPLPANVIGLLLLAACLFLKVVKLDWVEAASMFLIRHMLLFFAPLVAGTMVYFQLFAEQAMPVLVSLVVSTLGVLLISGRIVKWVARRSGREAGRDESV